MNTVFLAFTLTLIAGLGTGIGSTIAFLSGRKNQDADRKFLSVALGFSAGVMIYVAMVEILQKSREYLTVQLGDQPGGWAAAGAFFGGILLIAVIDRLIPSEENPHEVKSVKAGESHPKQLMRMGLFTALAIAIHNFPEGLATFVSALQEPSVALPIVAAITIHNIPEGIAVSVPIYQATGSRRKAFLYSFSSGLAEPLGALIGWIVLRPVLNTLLYGILFGMVAGIMVFISVDELLPAAREYGEHHLSIYGLIAGMAVMAVSLLLFV